MGDSAKRRARLAACMLLTVAASVVVMPVEAAGPFVVTGRVMDLDGEPIQGATVRGSTSGSVATTDTDGRYQIDYGLNAQSEYLTANAPGRSQEGAYTYGLTQFEPVDFTLPLRMTSSLDRPFVRSTVGLTIQASVSTAWRDDLCIRFSPPGSSTRTEVPFVADGSGVTGTAATSYQFPGALPDGAYFLRWYASLCDAPNISMGSAVSSFRVDSVGPSLSAQYPAPGASVPQDRVLPSFRLTDNSGVVEPVAVQLVDVTTSETISLAYTKTGSTYFPEGILVRDGHSYRISIAATDSLGNSTEAEWSFSGTAPVPTPTITDTAPFEYGERCEATYVKGPLNQSNSSCLSEPSAVRNGALRLVHGDVRVATDTVVAAAGYDFMGAGINYTVPRTGVVEATAAFSEGSGHGQLCIAAIKGLKDIVAVKCAPITSTEVQIQFPVITGQALRIGGYLMPACESVDSSMSCSAGAIVLLDRVTISFGGAP